MPDAPRDWDAEMAKIDRQIEASTKAGAKAAPATRPALPPGLSGADPGVARVVAASAARPVHGTRTGRALAVARVVLCVALGVGMLFWPYAARCGAGLAAYLGAVGAVVAGGVWSAVWTWRHRTPKSHVLALALILWGLVLAAIDILPRAGYATPTAAHPARWSCE